jgi:hypothetical protein
LKKGKSLPKTPHIAKRSTHLVPIPNTSSRSSPETTNINSISLESHSAFEALKGKRESMKLRKKMKKAKLSLCSLRNHSK